MMLKPAAVIFVRNNMVLSDTFLIRSEPFINRSNTWRSAKIYEKTVDISNYATDEKRKTVLCCRIILHLWYAGQACLFVYI